MLDIINLKAIKMGVKASQKEDVLNIISEIALENEIIKCKEQYLKGLVDRESEFTTGFGKGFAIPHCKSESVNRAAAIICKLENEVEWQSMDEKPVNFVLGLAIPESEAGTTHLKILSQLSRGLMDDEFTNELQRATSEIEIYDILTKKLNGGI